MDMSSSAPLGQQRAGIPVAGRLVVLTTLLAGGVATWTWLGHRHAAPPPASPPPARISSPNAAPPSSPLLAAAPAPPVPVTSATATPEAVPIPNQSVPERAARHMTAGAEITAPARGVVQPPALPARNPTAPQAPAAQDIQADSRAPSFDIVRISPHGEAVIAGRSEPRAHIVIAANGRPIAKTQADAQGQWVALPASPLPAGGQQLTLSTLPAKPSDVTRHGAAPVIVLVPSPKQAVPGAPSGALALLAPATGPPRLLQVPSAPDTRAGPPRLGLGTVDYDAQGAIRFAGTASPHSTVRMYIDRHAVGDATADAEGRWTLVPAVPVAEGHHQLRTDQLRDNGSVAARIALPFERVALPDMDVLDGKVVIQPGDDLWRIARHVYGRGIRYTVIYLANRGQIRNPDLIYPGQVFAVPAPSSDADPRPAPVSSSSSK